MTACERWFQFRQDDLLGKQPRSLAKSQKAGSVTAPSTSPAMTDGLQHTNIVYLQFNCQQRKSAATDPQQSQRVATAGLLSWPIWHTSMWPPACKSKLMTLQVQSNPCWQANSYISTSALPTLCTVGVFTHSTNWRTLGKHQLRMVCPAASIKRIQK